MSGAGVERQREALAIFDQVADLDPDERRQRLAELCAGDDGLRARVETLLAKDASTGEPFCGGVAQWAGAIDAGADALAQPGERIGAWRIVGLLGRGGMGAVYAVERADGAYAQRAALKCVHGGEISAAGRERFLRERQVLARLQHPHIAALIDGGFAEDGDPYFVMERVDGVPIDRWCDERRLGLRARVELFLQALDAVQYAHRNLVVHRDLKPSNLLVTPAGQVKLLDFGIARELEQAGLAATATGDRAMTLQYASPEQLNNEPVTTATDLYQLGVVLYRLLTGRHPFGIDADTPLAQQVQALSRDPEPIARGVRQSGAEPAMLRGETPVSLARALAGSLGAIVHACLRRDPEARYASAEALAADLRAWLGDRPVVAAKLDAPQRARLWLRRHRAFAASAAAVAIALLAGAGVALWQAHEAREQARLAQRESANARAAMQFLTDTLAAASPDKALDAEVSVRQLLEKARGQLGNRGAMDAGVRQSVQRMLGHLYYSLGEQAVSAQMFADGLRGVTPQTRADALALADDYAGYSDTLGSLEKGEESLAAARRSAELRDTFAAGDVEQHFLALDTLGYAHYSAGEDARAERYWREALGLVERLPSARSDEVVSIHYAMAAMFNFAGRSGEALELLDRGLAYADRNRVPADHPLRGQSQRIRGNVLLALGRPREADAAMRHALAIQEKSSGTAGAKLAAIYNDLGIILREQGRYREAIEATQRSYDMELAALEDEMSDFSKAISFNNLAVLHESFGDYPKALAQAEQCMEHLRRARTGKTELVRRRYERNHARILGVAGDVQREVVLLEQMRAQSADIDGTDSKEYALLSLQLAEAESRRKRTERGLQLLAEARHYLSRSDEPALRPQFTKLLRIEAALERQRSDLAAAVARQREAVRRGEQIGNPPDLAIARAELAGYLAAQGKREEARALLAQALPVMREALLPQEENRARAEVLARQLGV